MNSKGLVLALALAIGCLAGQSAAEFTLPSLPYPTQAMEPNIDNQTMWLHWNRHTNTARTRLNAAVTLCPQLGTYSLLQLVQSIGLRDRCGNKMCPRIPANCLTEVRNMAGGLWNHAFFFLHNLAPTDTQTYANDASPELKAAINRWFGSYDAFAGNFTSAASTLFGSGWAWLIAQPAGRNGFRLLITTTPNQDNPLMPAVYIRGTPLLGLVWEHAYYLKYQNVRGSYISAFYNVINWQKISRVYSLLLTNEWAGFDALTSP